MPELSAGVVGYGERRDASFSAAEPGRPHVLAEAAIRLRGSPRQVHRPVRPAAPTDRQAQAGRHRGGPAQGHRRVHRRTSGQGRPGTSTRRASSWSSRPPCSTSRRPACCPPAEVEDEEDLALLEARDLLFARLLQYKAYKAVAGIFRDGLSRGVASVSAWSDSSPGSRDSFPEVLLGLGPAEFASLAGRALQPKPVPLLPTSHLHAPLVSVREQGSATHGAAAAGAIDDVSVR